MANTVHIPVRTTRMRVIYKEDVGPGTHRWSETIETSDPTSEIERLAAEADANEHSIVWIVVELI